MPTSTETKIQYSESEVQVPKVAFVTLGCKVNTSDTQRAIADFRDAGFRIVPPDAPADVYIVNTCSVTHIADRKSRRWLRHGARLNPGALVVATGCYAESGRATFEEMPEVGLVVGYREKDRLLEIVMEHMAGAVTTGPQQSRSQLADNAQAHLLHTPSWAGGDATQEEGDYQSHTRAMVKIEDGCNDFCTFCIIPFTRGMPRSTSTGDVVGRVNQMLDRGYREIVLTGVHMGKYGQDHAQRRRAAADRAEAADLPGVVKAVLERTPVPRLRITSVEPTDALMMLPLLSDPLYSDRLAPHLHLPLQSGCDATLTRMKRDYITQRYADVVRQCREAVPSITITTDLIVGFPGETDEEWGVTLHFVQKIGFAKIHAFPFSRRPGTPAYDMPDQVDHRVRHTRTLEAIKLSVDAEATFACAQLGSTHAVLWERENSGVWGGLTTNYLRVHTHSTEDLHNRITPATLVAYDSTGLWAEI